MKNNIILLYTSILIDFFRKKNKTNSIFYKLSKKYNRFAVSTITRFKIFVCQNKEQNEFLKNFYKSIIIIDFTDKCAFNASEIAKQLKKDRNLIDTPDILIAATAITNNLSIATLNIKHFNRINDIKIIDHN